MKLFSILNKLNKKERVKFQHFLASPLFNKRTDLRQLFDLYLEEKNQRAPAKTFWAKLFPNKIYSNTEWNLLTSRLFKLLESFLVNIEMQKSEVQKKFYLAKVYRKLQVEHLFKKCSKGYTAYFGKTRFSKYRLFAKCS